MVSVPIVPRNTRWLSFPVTTSTIKCSGTLAFALELVNWRLPPSRVSRPVDFALTPSSPMNCTTFVPVAGCCATVGGAVNPTMPNRAIVAVCIERKTIAVSLTCSASFSRLGSRKDLRTRLVSGEQQSAVRLKKSMLALRRLASLRPVLDGRRETPPLSRVLCQERCQKTCLCVRHSDTRIRLYFRIFLLNQPLAAT